MSYKKRSSSPRSWVMALLCFAAVANILGGGLYAAPITIPVNCGPGPTHVGDITVDTSGAGVAGSFTSIVGTPVSMAAAAAACNEDHFNWYQTASGTHPLLPAPPAIQVDPQAGGQGTLWADSLPWYWDETRPPNPLPAGKTSPPTFIPPAGQTEVQSQTTATTLGYSDFPGGPPGSNVMFMTWLVSLNANGSFHSWHPGFSWSFTVSPTGVASATQPVAKGAGVVPTAAQYTNIIGGFDTAIPEPSTLTLAGFALLGLFVYARRRPRRA